MTIVHETDATGNVNGGSSITINKPSGTAEGDVLVCFIVLDSSRTITPPDANWHVIAAYVGQSYNNLTGYYKVAGGSEGASYQFALSGSTYGEGGISRYSGVDNSTPGDVAASTQSEDGVSGLTLPSITTVTNNAMLVMGIGISDNGQSVTQPSGWDEAYESKTVTLCESSYNIQASAGPSGSKAITASPGDTSIAGIMWALRPAGAGGISIPVNIMRVGINQLPIRKLRL